MIRINQVKCKPGHTMEQLKRKAADILRVKDSDILSFSVVRQSIDARRKPDIFYSYTVDMEVRGEEKICRRMKNNNQVSKTEKTEYRFPKPGKEKLTERPVIIGTGPAGLFCGYFLALHGYRPILLERGQEVERRREAVEQFWKDGILNPSSNVQFGEGGAGTFSDGKLNTLVKDKDGRNGAVLETFVTFGAKESIRYEAKPHIGTDVLCGVVKRMREEIIRLGGEVRFESQVTDILINNGTESRSESGVDGETESRSESGVDGETESRSESGVDSGTDRAVAGVVINGQEVLPCSQVVLAIGHSARDTFDMLYRRQIPMEAKAFAVGLRVEHPQEMINKSQYGTEDAGVLGAAPYKVTAQTSVGRGVYSFCMCPGGYVVNASSEPGRLAVNGMSYSGRNGENANSAIIVAVTPKDYGSNHPLAGIAFQRELEERAYSIGQGRIPVQRYGDFRRRAMERSSEDERTGSAEESIISADRRNDSADEAGVKPQLKGQWVFADVSRILPEECNAAFVEGMEQFGRMIPGFDREDALLSGVESRTSSPVRISRGEKLQTTVEGLYPCGEGAGYAGGITSAAMDGIRVAEMIAQQFRPF